MSDVANPYDRFFKEAFSRPEVAEDFLLHVLPRQISSLVCPGTFRLRKDSFVDTHMSEYFSDLLYQVDFKGDAQGFLYTLFEHKSYPAPDVALQLLRYMTRILAYAAKETGIPLPPVFPVVVYHGAEKWSIPLDFAALYQGPASLRSRLLDFSYCLADLSTYTDAQLKAAGAAALAALLLKHIHSDDLAERLVDIFRLLLQMDRQTALESLESVLRYLGAATDRVTREDCREAMREALTETGELHMDEYRLIDGLIEDHLERNRPKWMLEAMEEGRAEAMEEGRAEAMEEGRAEGKKEGMATLTIRQLTRKFGGLDHVLEERVRQLPLDELVLLGEELLDLPDEPALIEWLDKRRTAH
ncbi:MAG: Rpn family recombination-promoting nuclease/putative transposase [Thermodesulfobacteriota bacterium]